MCHGGGVHCQEGSSPTIENCIFLENRALGHGAGVYCTASSPTFRDCKFIRNSATMAGEASGGACSIWGKSSPVFLNCEFLENEAKRGGGAIGFYGITKCRIENCIFSHNTATDIGGGHIECGSRAAPQILDCTFHAGMGPEGSAFHCKDRAHPVFEKTIIAYGELGMAIHCVDDGQATLRCCDLFANAGGDWVGTIEAQHCTDGNVSADPHFADPANGDFHLHPDSPLLKLEGCGAIGADGRLGE
ncbi:right-handed parallel beta-helix repeat-containing protein [Candidatus Eisenbacteria bacterium]|uniref:Right-handed parallel beta-helix repeat-containing protein n=1 Tax=Eiseniibacteriota bacterium TaxID=2212470 RepID=A0ABV6YMG8_UNCEI